MSSPASSSSGLKRHCCCVTTSSSGKHVVHGTATEMEPAANRGGFRRREASVSTSCGRLREVEPGVDDGVGVQGHRLDPLLDEPLRQVGMVAGALATDAHVLPAFETRLDGHLEYGEHRRIALVEARRDQAGVAVQAKHQLSHVV